MSLFLHILHRAAQRGASLHKIFYKNKLQDHGGPHAAAWKRIEIGEKVSPKVSPEPAGDFQVSAARIGSRNARGSPTTSARFSGAWVRAECFRNARHRACLLESLPNSTEIPMGAVSIFRVAVLKCALNRGAERCFVHFWVPRKQPQVEVVVPLVFNMRSCIRTCSSSPITVSLP